MILLSLLALPWLVGCSGASTLGTVNGTVTLDGQPLKEGDVRFVPVDGKSQTASAKVVGGKFTAAVPVGEMRVEFSAPKVIGRHKMYDTPDSPMVEDIGELLPDRYNVRSELKITVKKGSQDETFPLKAK
jgi:hypothetical protein